MVAATNNGLYERVAAAGAGFDGTGGASTCIQVVVARTGGVTTWFAAPLGGGVLRSTNGNTWAAVGTGFPGGIGRIALGVQPDNTNVLYALIADTNGLLHSVRRLDGGTGAWRNITGVPNVLPGGQGDYDLCIALDPNDANRIYLGGDFFNADPFPGSIWRCVVTASAGNLSMTGTSIGGTATRTSMSWRMCPGFQHRVDGHRRRRFRPHQCYGC